MNGIRGLAGLRRASWLALGVLFGTVFPLSAALGQVSTWNAKVGGGLTSGNWGTAKNWNPVGVPNGKAAQAIFPDGIAGNATISLDKTYSIIFLELNSSNAAAAYTIQSTAGGAGALKFLENPNNMGLNGTIPIIMIPDTNMAQNTIALPVMIDADQALQITNDSAARLTISGVISGAKAKGLVFDGAGNVLLTGTNTYKGTTIIDGGFVSIQNNAALGAKTAGIELLGGGILQGLGTAPSVSANRTITLGNAVESANGILSGDPSGKGIFTVHAMIQSGGLAGGGDLGILNSVRLTNTANTFKTTNGILVGGAETDGVLYLRGNVEAKTDGVMGDPSNKIVLTHGTIVDESTFTSAREISLNLPGTIRVIANKTLTWNGAITGGNSNLIKRGDGTLVLGGNNTFNHLVIRAGTAAVSADTNLGKAGTAVRIHDGSTLRVDAPFATARGIQITGSGVINANFANNAAAGQDFNVKGVVSGGTLIKKGTGIVTLSNNKNSQSATQINQGALAVSTDGNLGPKASSLTIGAGGILRVTDSFTTARSIFDTGVTTAGAIFVVKNKTLTVDSGISGPIARFLKDGDGTLTLAKGSTSSFGLSAQVNAGTLVINGAMTTGTGLLNAKGAVVAGSGTVAGNFDNAGKVTPGNDPGTLTVTGNVTMEATSHFGFDINAANGGVSGGSIGWGLLKIGGELDLLGQVNLDVQTYSLSGNTGPTDPGLFNPLSSYSWEFAEAAGGISGFSPSLFNIGLSGFENPTAPGSSFSVVEQGNGLFLDYTAGPASVPEPGSLLLLLIGGATILTVRWARGNTRLARDGN